MFCVVLIIVQEVSDESLCSHIVISLGPQILSGSELPKSDIIFVELIG